MKVSAVIPTRGDVDLSPILETLDWCDDVVVWNNAKQDDLGLYGRYAAIAHAEHSIVVTQDDDVLVSCWDDILAAYEPGKLVVNYPQPWDIPWVARGAIFDSNLPEQAFQRYEKGFARDHYFTHYACDGVFALLTPTVVLDFGSEDLPHGNDNGRISTSPGWYDEKRPMIQERCAQVAA